MCCSRSLICPRGLVLWVPEHTAVSLFRASQINRAGLAIAPLLSGLPLPQLQLSQSHPSELSMPFKLCSPHHCPRLPLNCSASLSSNANPLN